MAVACLLSVLSARGLHRELPESAPEYRRRGEPDARVVIVEYSDFQCPACRAAEEPLRQILALYGKQVRLVFKHFPLEGLHTRAREAAVASECAGRQGRFWPFHHLLYEKQEEWTQGAPLSSRLAGYARDAGVDASAFEACLKDPSAAAGVSSDIDEGTQRWVGSTPTFFVNGKRLVGPRQLSSLGTILIDRALKK